MLKTIGLTTFPKKRLKANQALLKGPNALGVKIVMTRKITAKNAQVIAGTVDHSRIK